MSTTGTKPSMVSDLEGMNPTFKERIQAPIPQRELNRRWAEVRKAMKAAGIDSLIMQNDNQFLGGYVRYFLDLPAQQAYPTTVIFPVNDDMTVIAQGGKVLPFAPPAWAVRGVKEKFGAPFWRSVCITDTVDAEEAVPVIKKRGDKKVGLVAMGCMHASFYKYLTANLPGVEFVDASDLVDQIKCVKSEDELVYIRHAVAEQDRVLAAMPALLRPGRYESEIRNDVIHLLADLGSEEQLVMLSSAPPGQRAGHLYPFYQNRRVQAGDQFMMMIEPNGMGGFYGEAGRTWVLGEPPKDLLKTWEVAVAAQKHSAKLARPGVMPGDIFKANNEFLKSKGYTEETRLYAHGQGYDLVERPVFRPNETMPLKVNMFLAIHPTAFSDTTYGYCCDNYLVTETETVRLHKTPQEILVVDC